MKSIRITLVAKKPRNPTVAPMRFRAAGGHRMRAGASRRNGRRSVREELEAMSRASP
jgi:hypothetical protein